MRKTVREFAPAKVNLALHILGRRTDGYHDIDSVVAFADVGDVLEIAAAEQTDLNVDGVFASDVPLTAENLVLRAYAALALRADVPPVSFRLTKNLPVASGIGGGSTDSAAALRGLMRLTGVTLDADELKQIALCLGADVPVCLYGKSCRMQGVGEVISPLGLLPAKAIVMVNPLQACGTADVFKAIGLKAGETLGSALDVSNPATWRNDMTAAARHVLPVIGDVLAALSGLPDATAVRMSGSGATCFALFDDLEKAEVAARMMRLSQPLWWCAAARLT